MQNVLFIQNHYNYVTGTSMGSMYRNERCTRHRCNFYVGTALLCVAVVALMMMLYIDVHSQLVCLVFSITRLARRCLHP